VLPGLQRTFSGGSILETQPDDGSWCRLQDPNRTILGAPQRTYLKDQLSAAEGKQTWKVLGQQVSHWVLGVQGQHSAVLHESIGQRKRSDSSLP
jgi:phosphodiesterase/alkaline phosphatase D-like protein